MDANDAIAELTLMLMYLTSWRERDGENRRCWKGYEFEILDRLESAGLITSSHRAKSAYLTADGEERARQLLTERGLPIEWP
jgi:hypothetical protein